jgi:hypothetical protein
LELLQHQVGLQREQPMPARRQLQRQTVLGKRQLPPAQLRRLERPQQGWLLQTVPYLPA